MSTVNAANKWIPKEPGNERHFDTSSINYMDFSALGLLPQMPEQPPTLPRNTEFSTL